MMFKEILAKMKGSDEFKKWHAEHDGAYLAHIFFTDEDKESTTYDVGYYVPGKDKMASFEVGGGVCLKDFSDVFKEPGKSVKRLETEKINTTADEALEKARQRQEEKYPKSKPLKRIVILQHLDKGQVWNITYVTQNFETLNIKISAEKGIIVEDKLQKIFDFDKQ